MSRTVFRGFCGAWLISLIFAGQVMAQTTNSCEETDPNKFFSLINAPVQSYIPPLDRNGNTILSENDVFIQKSRHYFAELKEFPNVTISMERFASVTENNPTALENFESKITVLGPDCSKINMYRSRLVGTYDASFKKIMSLLDLAIRTENEAITTFATSQLTPLPLSFDQTVSILTNDLALDVDVVEQMLPPTLRSQFLSNEEEIPLNSMAEMAMLAYSVMGGSIKGDVTQVYVFVPKTIEGLNPNQETLMLSSDGKLYGIQAFDYEVAAKVLSRLGVRTSIVSLSEARASGFGHCKIDIAGKWMQIVDGKKIRDCPFTELVRQMLQDGSYVYTKDYRHNRIIFDAVEKIMNF